ncbi:MAG: glycosyltransferase [Bacteroidaceae bacterium]|nr:glycosyltransferase [Bacteroidaceae bacterium]
MGRKELISVIVCTYNQEGTIARTLDSILRQDCHVPIEILIGEDCSSDHTLDVCRQYAEKYPDVIRLFANKPNKGIVNNYFDCLLAAQGKYIADCAGDDEWSDPQKLEKELCILEAHPEVTIVHTNYLHRDAITGLLSSPHPHPCFHLAEGEMTIVDGQTLLIPILTQLSRPIIHLCTALYRTDVMLKAYHAHTSFMRNKDYGCEDVQVSLMLARAGKVAYLNEKTLYYTTGGATISSTHDDAKQFRFVKNVTQLGYDLSQTFGIQDKKLQEYFDYRVYALLMHAFRAHNAELRAEALLCQRQWKAHLNMKAQRVKTVTSIPFLWSCALAFRKMFVLNSHHCHE